MTLELRFFHPCDHQTKSEPLILDSHGIARTTMPIVSSGMRILEENIEVLREPIIRSTEDDVDTLTGPTVSAIDLIVQELLHQGNIEIRKYKQNRDYILTSDRLILWKDTAAIKPNPGELYFVSYRTSRLVKNFRVIDSQTIKINSFNLRRSYVVDYVTTPEFCTKCIGDVESQPGQTRPAVMYDLAYDPVGDFLSLQGVEKLKQDLIRAILVIRGSNPREPAYGTSIDQSIGTAQVGPIFESLLAQEVRNSLGLLRTLQRLQAEVQNVDPSEILTNVIEVKVRSDDGNDRAVNNLRSVDPTLYNISIVVENGTQNLVDFFVPLDVFAKDANAADLPTIAASNIQISTIGRFSVIITWETNIPTDSIIEFGETDELSNRETGTFGTKHFVTISGLKAGMQYYYKIITQNRGFLFGAELRTFKTLP